MVFLVEMKVSQCTKVKSNKSVRTRVRIFKVSRVLRKEVGFKLLKQKWTSEVVLSFF